MHEILPYNDFEDTRADRFEPANRGRDPGRVAHGKARSDMPKSILKATELHQAARDSRTHSLIDADGRVDPHRPQG